MDAQLINWGGLAGLLALGVAILRVLVVSARDTSRSLRGQDKELAGLKGDVAGLDAKVSGLAEGQAGLDVRVAGLAEGQAGLDARVAGLEKGQERIGLNLLQVVDGLGVVKGELKRIAPSEKVPAGSS